MTEPPGTRPSLLVRLRDAADADAWRQFVQLYAPLVYRYARNHRLQDADAADLTQEVLRAVHRGIETLEYAPQLGSFRGWLFTLAHHRLCDLLTRRQRQAQGTGGTTADELLREMPAPPADAWDRG